MKQLSCCLLLLYTVHSFSQNLITNGNFESYTTCPAQFGQLNCSPWNNPLVTTSPDYFNSCNTVPVGVPSNFLGFQNAHSGTGYAGILLSTTNTQGTATNWREYIQAPLADTLSAGTEYFLSFFVSPADSCRYTSNNLGVYFSNTEIHDSIPISSITPLPVQPQLQNPVSNNLDNRNIWTLLSFSYIASGGEKFMVIGNFNDSVSTVLNFTGWTSIRSFSYLYIDDVCLSTDSNFCSSLNATADLNNNNILKIFPNPSNGIFTINSTWHAVSYQLFSIEGKLVKEILKPKEEIQIDVSSLPAGIYFLQVLMKETVVNRKIVVE
jgi:hypothetical protein